MEEIKVGEYIRTKYGIAKFIDYEIERLGIIVVNKKIAYDHIDEYKNVITPKEILKHSFNIIDLIEEGDIIKYTPKGIKSIHIDIVRKIKDARSGNETLAVNLYSIGQIDIISIVTKEQFKDMEYEVK